MDLDYILTSLERKKVEHSIALHKNFKSLVLLREFQNLLRNLEKTKVFLTTIAKECQKETIEYIENTVTYFIQIYGPEWKFEIEIKEQRDQQEFLFWFHEGDIRHSIKDDIVAGGIIDMTNIGLRFAVHSLDPEAEPILLFDEPGKNLGNKVEEGMELIKLVTKERVIQVVIITHDERVMAIGDKAIKL